ncbi:amidohydrolase [Knoellia sinensis KCTC 19936]|uniref:Amidohydrolase n=1 Tax=Knoellia sinensis KCTC 19936 TaxID=1385520 RepID=A0A0A0J2C1_9MICO|nr:amidohydrolase [Knoellia sinensis]KGN29806.1 amidohydrolase [Knoellia sinensis KCTC 19936]
MTDTLTALGASVTSALPELIELRRDLHAHPELSRQESRTTDVIVERLESAGVRVRRLRGTGLVADLGAEQPAYRVALRADMDALPVQERTGLPFASTTDGVAHACGHDVHVTALVGAILALKEHEEALRERGTAVRAIFQAAEEVIPGGAQEAIAQGVMEGVDAIFALHCDPSLDVGQVGLREGPITAACDHIRVRLTGRGGHTSRPQLTEDLTYALAKVITDVPAALSRRLDPRAGAALVWGVVRAGAASNVIPSEGECSGTLRMLDANAWLTVGPILDEIVAGVVAPYGVEARLERIKGVPPVVNQADAIDALRFACLGAGLHIAPTGQSLGGEDYSWYLTHAPGAMARLGTRTPGGRTYDLHQGDVVIDEEAIGCGARLLASVVVAHTVKADGDTLAAPIPKAGTHE